MLFNMMALSDSIMLATVALNIGVDGEGAWPAEKSWLFLLSSSSSSAKKFEGDAPLQIARIRFETPSIIDQ